RHSTITRILFVPALVYPGDLTRTGCTWCVAPHLTEDALETTLCRNSAARGRDWPLPFAGGGSEPSEAIHRDLSIRFRRDDPHAVADSAGARPRGPGFVDDGDDLGHVGQSGLRPQHSRRARRRPGPARGRAPAADLQRAEPRRCAQSPPWAAEYRR